MLQDDEPVLLEEGGSVISQLPPTSASSQRGPPVLLPSIDAQPDWGKHYQQQERDCATRRAGSFIDSVFRNAEKLVLRFHEMAALRERAAATLLERKRLLVLGEDNGLASFGGPELKMFNTLWTQTKKRGASYGLRSRTETDAEFTGAIRLTSSDDDDDGDDDDSELCGDEAALQFGRARDPDVEKTVALLASIRDLLSVHTKPSNASNNGKAKKGSQRQREGSAGSIPQHIVVLKNLGFDTTNFEREEEEEEKQRQDKDERGESDDDDDILMPRFVAPAAAAAVGGVGSLSVVSQSSPSAYSSPPSRAAALVSALQFQAAAAALGEREALRRNWICTQAMGEGWESFAIMLRDMADRSMYRDFLAAKQRNGGCSSLSASPPNNTNNNTNNSNVSNWNAGQPSDNGDRRQYPRFQPSPNYYLTPDPVELARQQQQHHHYPMAQDRNQLVHQYLQQQQQPHLDDDHERRKLALYRDRKRNASSPQQNHYQQQQQPPPPPPPSQQHQQPQQQAAGARPVSPHPHAPLLHGNKTTPTRRSENINNNNNNRLSPGTAAAAAAAGANSILADAKNMNMIKGPLSATWAAVQGLDLASQLAALRKELARMPTPQRNSAMHTLMGGQQQQQGAAVGAARSSPSGRAPTATDSNKIMLTPSPEQGSRGRAAARSPAKKRIVLTSSSDDDDDDDATQQRRRSRAKLPPPVVQRPSIERKFRSEAAADMQHFNDTGETAAALRRSVARARNQQNDEGENGHHHHHHHHQATGFSGDEVDLSNFVASWMYVSDGDVRMTWTRRYLRFDPHRRCIYASARGGAVGKPMLFLVPSNELHTISHLQQHSHIVSPFAFPPASQRFFLIDVSPEQFSGQLLRPPDLKLVGSGISLLLKDAVNGALANIVLCAENHVRAGMWVSALSKVVVQNRIL